VQSELSFTLKERWRKTNKYKDGYE